MDNPSERIPLTNTIIKSPSSPSNISKEINSNGYYTLQTATGLTDSELLGKKFYKNGVEVNPKSNLSTNSPLTSGDESLPATISFTFTASSSIPLGGTIGVNALIQCYDSTINIINVTNGVSSITNSSPLAYSWEMSYDQGITWGAADDSADGESITSDSVDVKGAKSNFLIRRKVRERLGVNTTRFNYSNILKIEISKNNIVFPSGATNAVAARILPGNTKASVSLPIVSSSISNSTIKYYKPDGSLLTTNPIGTSIALGELSEGEYLYKVEVTNLLSSGQTCSTTEQIKVIVYNISSCSTYIKRVPATIPKDWTSGVSFVTNTTEAVNGNKASGASLNGGVVLLGIGTVGIDLYFTKSNGTLYTGEELKGKKVVVKIGEQYSGLKVAGGISVIGRLTNSDVTSSTVALTNANNVGAALGVKGGVLDVLKGDNVFEYSFIPKATNGSNIAYNGVRIQLGSLIGIADLATVFYAYVEEDGTINGANDLTTLQYCDLINQDIKVSPPSSLNYPPTQKNTEGVSIPIANTNIKLNRSVEDAFWGNYSEVLNVASSLNPVIYPYYSVDNDYNSYSIFSTTVGALNAQFLQAQLRQPARLRDQVQITLSYPGINVLNLSLLQLGNFKIIYYLEGVKVGEELLENFRVLDIGLFKFDDQKKVILSKPANFMFDKIELFQFSVVNVNLGEGLKIYDIRVNPLIAFDSQADPKLVTQICAANPIVIEKPDDCTTYDLSFARVTRFGTESYKDANGNIIVDYQGNPIYPIMDYVDLTLSEMNAVGLNQMTFTSIDYPGQMKAYFELNLNKLFIGPNYDGKMLLKIQAKRQGCIYSEPQFLRVNMINCNQGIVNPIIRNSAIY